MFTVLSIYKRLIFKWISVENPCYWGVDSNNERKTFSNEIPNVVTYKPIMRSLLLWEINLSPIFKGFQSQGKVGIVYITPELNNTTRNKIHLPALFPHQQHHLGPGYPPSKEQLWVPSHPHAAWKITLHEEIHWKKHQPKNGRTTFMLVLTQTNTMR